jgi:hypothetical protein
MTSPSVGSFEFELSTNSGLTPEVETHFYPMQQKIFRLSIAMGIANNQRDDSTVVYMQPADVVIYSFIT